MNKGTVQKLVVIGVVTVAAMVLILLIAPGTSADDTIFVGIDEDKGNCFLFDGILPEPNTDYFVPPDQTIINVTPSENNNILLRCEDKRMVPNNSGSAVTWDAYNNPFSNGGTDPVPCFVTDVDSGALGITDNWTITISAQGNGVLSCHFNDNQPTG